MEPTPEPARGQAKIRGTVFLARRTFVQETYGQDAWQRVLGHLREDERLSLQGLLLPIGWLPFELYLRLDEAIAVELSPGAGMKVFVDLGRASAEVNLKGTQSSWVRSGDPHFLLGLAPVIYRFYYSSGRSSYERLGDTSGVLRVFDAETVTASDCRTVCGWYQRAIELCGGREVTVRESRCRLKGAPCCEFLCAWR